jgi:hypothetical protein
MGVIVMRKFLIILVAIIGYVVSANAQDISGLYCYKIDNIDVTLQLFSNGKCQYSVSDKYDKTDLSGSYSKDGNTITIKWDNVKNPEYGQYTPATVNRQTKRPLPGKEASIQIKRYTLKKGKC